MMTRQGLPLCIKINRWNTAR